MSCPDDDGVISASIRRWLITAAVADGAFRAATRINIERRLTSQIRGQKRMWAAAATMISSAGALPSSYFVFGRRRQP